MSTELSPEMLAQIAERLGWERIWYSRRDDSFDVWGDGCGQMNIYSPDDLTMAMLRRAAEAGFGWQLDWREVSCGCEFGKNLKTFAPTPLLAVARAFTQLPLAAVAGREGP